MKKSLKINSYLIITSSGGAGILHAAKAQKQMIENQDSNAKVVKKDILLDWLGRIMGNFAIITWALAQKKGNVWLQEFLVSLRKILEIFSWPKIFFSAYRVLLKENIDYVIDTQPLATSAIIKAIRLYNKIRKKNVILKKIIVDLPTKKSTHYFTPIKKLSKKDKKHILISSIEPLLEKNQTQKEFWQKFCDISMDNIVYEPYPIRQSFYKLANKEYKKGDYLISINFTDEDEVHIIEEVAKKGNIEMLKKESSFDFHIKEDDYLITMVLGSKPCFKAIFNYICNLIEFMQDHSTKKNIVIFTYCSISKDPLIKKLYNMILKIENYPKNLTIVPMCFQPEDVIAALYFRSDMTISRSAGQTVIELMEVSKNAKFYIHTEVNLRVEETFDEILLKGMPSWEAGSANYMQEKMNAKLINPVSFIDMCKKQLI